MSYQYFRLSELCCPCCGACNMNDDFMELLIAMRHEAGFPFVVNSGFRCERHNAMVGGKKSSAHLFGRAVDIAARGERVLEIIALGRKFGMTGYGIAQKGQSRFIHLDNMQHAEGYFRPTIWTY